MATYRLVKGDTLPRLNFTLTKNGSPLNLTGATVRFKFRKQGTSTTNFARSCIVSDPVAGKCYYDWQVGDLSESGDHQAEVEVTFPDGKVRTFIEFLNFSVRDEL
jgi:hypothetical protein